MSRKGKIARMPLEVRNEVNRRLDDGEGGAELLDWLNGLPEVGAILAAKFGGRPVNKQNLSDWRNGGYRDWQTRNEVWSEVREEMEAQGQALSENAGELAKAGKGRLTDHLATALAARYASLLLRWNGQVTDEFKGKQAVLGKLCQSIEALRRGDHTKARLGLEQERRLLMAGLAAGTEVPMRRGVKPSQG